MLENRSFDHVLGYLALPNYALPNHNELPVAVDGLQNAFANPHGGQPYPPEPFDEETFLERDVDPPHDFPHVAIQMAGGAMTGFVDALADSLQAKGRAADAADPEILKTVMGHMTPEHVPVYDHLARNFCVCDQWFCSVPGPTLPNRFYSVAGTIDGARSNNDLIIGKFAKLRSFFRYLPPTSWRWYSSDPGILRAVDENFTFDDEHDHFAYFDQLTEAQPRSFLRDVLGDSEREPELPAVSWIDPNFNLKDVVGVDWPWLDRPGSNDDHPPAPVILGQKLVHKIYRALGESKYWKKCLLVVMYDEHGGFFDHKQPPNQRGPRIPALLVSPHVKRGVCSEPFHHASVIKTILLRFGEAGSIHEMPASVAEASDLSVALRDDGVSVPFSDVPNPGGAAIELGDFEPEFLPNDGSTVARALSFADTHLSDLQKDIVLAIAIPLRTGYRFMRRARKRPWLAKLGHVLRWTPKKRLKPRRP
jgi:phospholipase C